MDEFTEFGSRSPEELLARIQTGDREALIVYIAKERESLRKIANKRIHPSLRSRVDFSDVIQEVTVQAIDALNNYIKAPKLSVRHWLRALMNSQILQIHRHHLGAKKRDARREVSATQAKFSVQSDILAEKFLARNTPPLDAVLRAERKNQIQAAIEALDPIDQEILMLKHFEKMDSKEAALILGISVEATSKRYFRALRRLKLVLTPLSSDLTG